MNWGNNNNCAVQFFTLTSEDRNTLQTIYGVRLRLFVSTILVMVLMMLWTQFKYGMLLSYSYEAKKYTLITPTLGWICFEVFVNTVVFLPCFFIFRRRIWAYRKDLIRGEKGVRYPIIAYKQFFPITSQYFVGLNDIDNMHQEVEGTAFEQLHEGDAYPIYFAPCSGYVFNMRGSITAM